ncbi:RING finger protein nhl-1 [Camponotus floridanus]|uniref:RING finger protein nhl-1 n=1 Tax=Camponotus floridanus TaxID=104421 RepID=E2B0L9_CAMFO|nr:RING finger protein nhl-1 [Camponotus floridanus]
MEQFEQLLTCAICLDRYRNPKLLPCQHSFCMEPCMDGLVDYVRRQVKCPECRAEHRIPYQGVQAFPTNVTLQRFLELHIEITGELPDPTSGQTMERCGVCSEKSYCSLCVHCEKKCCPECKDAHMDILRREIARINSQVRRGIHRLQDALALVEKNTLGLQTNCASVAEEVDEIYRRLSKALKDRTEHLRNEVDRYLGTELRGLIQLKENLELEIANIQSNCDLAEAHINENVPWDDAELLDTKELFLRTVEFIRNFEYEAGDYSRRVRFVMAHDPNQLVLHVAGYGELNIKPESGSGGLLGSSSSLAPPGGSPGLMRSKSDHRLASQYRQQEEERLARNRYVPEYEYEAPEYEVPRNKSRYRSRFMRHRDGDDSDGDSRSTVRFTSTAPQEPSGLRERVLDTEDAARGPLSGIFRLTDSPRVMKKLQECERAGKRKKEEPTSQPQVQQPQTPKPQVQVRKVPTAMARQTSEDDEISRIKKQNKSAAAHAETVEERQPTSTPVPVHPPPPRELAEPEEQPVRRSAIVRRTSAETHAPPAARSASSDSSTGSESSTGSGIRNTGAPFSTEEMKQKYLSRTPPTNTPTAVSSVPAVTTPRESSNIAPAPRTPFQSRFLGAGNRAAPPPPIQAPREEPATKKKDEEEDEDEETSSSSEETEYSSPRGSPAQSVTTMTTTMTAPSGGAAMTTTSTTPGGYTSRFVAHVAQTTAHDEATSNSSNPHDRNRFRAISADGSTDERRYSAGRDEDVNKVIAATATIADYAFNVDDDGDALKPPRATNTRSSRTDIIITDTDKSITSSTSSHLAISEPESDLLEGSRGDSRVASVAAQDEATLVEGRSGNDEISLIAGVDRERDGSTLAIDDDTETRGRDGEKREKPEDAPCLLRIVVEDVDAIVGEQRTSDLMSRSVETIDEPISRDRSRSKESQTVSECSSSISGRTISDSESEESDSDSGSEEEDEEEVEDDESRDENCNVKKEKREEDKNDSGYKGSEKREVGEKNEDSSSSGNDEETTVLSVSSGLGESSKTPDDRYERDLKRRSASIIDERSIEEMFDDNGWVITEQDLQQDLQTMSAIPSGFGFMDDQIVEKTEDGYEEPIPIVEREHETLDNLEDTSNIAMDDVEMTPPSESGSSEGPSRSRVYKQSSLGKNGWLVSDESESESERATPPGLEVPYNRDVAQIEGLARENEASRGIEDSGIDENGWVILDDDDDDVADGRVGKRSAQESTIRSQTTDLVTKTNTENGALLLANATQSKGEQSRLLGEREETRPVGAIVSIPVQMVTTVFCVSVLCYTVLTNLLL